LAVERIPSQAWKVVLALLGLCVLAVLAYVAVIILRFLSVGQGMH